VFIILTYVSTLEQARQLVAKLLELKWIVCANIAAPVESHYQWNGALCQEQEVPVFMKVTSSQRLDARKYLEAHHPYTVPVILDWPVQVNAAYQEWAYSLEHHDGL
jgi:periplasmic divalent cation tolerance protein